MREHCFIQLTSYTDSEVVPKHLSDVPDKICPVGETIRDWLPLLTIRGVWTMKTKRYGKNIFNFTNYHNQN